MSRYRAPVFALLVLPVLLGSRCGDEPDPDPDLLGPSDLTPPEVTLQVISIDPARGTPGTPFLAQIYGAEFDDGAKVRFGNKQSPRVDALNDNTLEVTVPAMELGTFDVTVTNPDGEHAVLRRGLSISGDAIGASCRSLAVYFDFDSSELQLAGINTLQAQSDCLRQSRGTLRLEGHCDARGTTEYNIALGDRRAHAVQRWLVGQGVSPGRITTVSYGEERPANSGYDEYAWSQNRRVEITLKD